MTAPVHPDDDPQLDAASVGGAPQSAEESNRARELAELFGGADNQVALRSEVDEAASHASLAALFGKASSVDGPSAAMPDFSWDPDLIKEAEPLDAAPPGFAGAENAATETVAA